jgi:hypothetical protein
MRGFNCQTETCAGYFQDETLTLLIYKTDPLIPELSRTPDSFSFRYELNGLVHRLTLQVYIGSMEAIGLSLETSLMFANIEYVVTLF